MKAIILAAGRGSRLGNLTDDRPKGMVAVGDKPMLEWQMAALGGAGITDVTIVRGYQGQAIPYPDVTYRDNPRWNETNMVGSLLAAGDILDSDDCVISYADIIYPASVVSKLIAGDGDIRITYDVNWLELWEKRFSDPLLDAETFQVDQDGCLLEIGQKPKNVTEVQGQYMGLLYFSRIGSQKILAFLARLTHEELDRLDMTSLLKRLIVAGQKIHTVKVDDKWLEVDSESDLQLFERIW